ncbi:putative chemotaxis protein [Neospora caninum Liverpool]|uniref:Putative chemotaxis protein n=1 Tax=Neospora caninum (strain Liverpool) TaxID=572307 RepID=F0VME4_NEOCL|nr:putative chemotaxis protein [Neospora caninum Liverpool]CBZ54890.1 putative chemotaxis protein [Neospora caninum Liverpool]|eukprot:XP_003884918.1 putative chemotaxis protein [Neospora caninum Liverpool]
MPHFVPVYDPEKPRAEQDDAALHKHRRWEVPHAVLPRRQSRHGEEERDERPPLRLSGRRTAGARPSKSGAPRPRRRRRNLKTPTVKRRAGRARDREAGACVADEGTRRARWSVEMRQCFSSLAGRRGSSSSSRSPDDRRRHERSDRREREEIRDALAAVSAPSGEIDMFDYMSRKQRAMLKMRETSERGGDRWGQGRRAASGGHRSYPGGKATESLRGFPASSRSWR